MSLVLQSSGGGQITIQEPATASNFTQTLPAATGTVVIGSSAVSAAGQIPFSTDGTTYTPTAKIVSGTAVASTSGTSIDFTSIPSWAKRITLMFDNISTNGNSSAVFLVQIGNTTFTTSGYSGSWAYTGPAYGGSASTVGFPMMAQNTADIHSGQATINLLSGSSFKYTFSSTIARTDGFVCLGGSTVTLGALLDRVRVTTSNGTDVFDAGNINILYE